jgi:hypothetical protein
MQFPNQVERKNKCEENILWCEIKLLCSFHSIITTIKHVDKAQEGGLLGI